MEDKNWELKYTVEKNKVKDIIGRILGITIMTFCILMILLTLITGDKLDTSTAIYLVVLLPAIAIVLIGTKKVRIDTKYGIWLNNRNYLQWKSIIDVTYLDNNLTFLILNSQTNEKIPLKFILVGNKSKRNAVEIENYFRSLNINNINNSNNTGGINNTTEINTTNTSDTNNDVENNNNINNNIN